MITFDVIIFHIFFDVINFIIMAFILFLLLKFVNKVLAVGKKEEKKDPIKTDEVILLEEIRDLLKKSRK